MAKIAIIYWTGTGNTREMAEAAARGVRAAGCEARLAEVEEIRAEEALGYDGLMFGCPAMGDEVLEESAYEPFFAEVEGQLRDKPVALFGSYGWGDGQWMRDWTERMQSAGAEIVGGEGLICNETPDEEALEECRELGKQLAS